MSALSDRVREIVRPAVRAVVPRDQTTPLPEVPLRQGDVERALGGERRDSCVVIERRRAGRVRHGRVSVESIAEQLAEAEAEASMFAGHRPARPPFMFFDLETTGLSGGAGTHAFLVGCGWFEDGDFVTRQFVMTRYADERKMLEHVAAEFGRAGAMVSFNGKSFDAPLLETRCLFHRLAWFGGELPHIDVLHPARLFWKRETCSLSTLEQQVVGHRRTGDVPGFEIPGRYFQFVRTGDAAPLQPILEHNRLDLLSLAALTGRLLYLARRGPESSVDAREALALGHVYARSGSDERARASYTQAIERTRAPKGAYDAVKIEALRALAIACRRGRLFEDAARCWRELLDTRGCPPHISCEAAEALAIHHEHRRKDCASARSFVLDVAMESLGLRKKEAIAYRLRRLDRKLSRSGGLKFEG